MSSGSIHVLTEKNQKHFFQRAATVLGFKNLTDMVVKTMEEKIMNKLSGPEAPAQLVELFDEYLKSRPKIELNPASLLALREHEERMAKGVEKFVDSEEKARQLIFGNKARTKAAK